MQMTKQKNVLKVMCLGPSIELFMFEHNVCSRSFIMIFNLFPNVILTFCLYFKDKDEDETEDFNIKPDDNLIVAGHVDQDFSTLEISGDHDTRYTTNTLLNSNCAFQ